jgi:hypothetical protein
MSVLWGMIGGALFWIVRQRQRDRGVAREMAARMYRILKQPYPRWDSTIE